MISLGVYPDVSIAMARERRDAVRREVAAGMDPSAGRQASRAARAIDFKTVAEELMESQAARLDPGTMAQKAALAAKARVSLHWPHSDHRRQGAADSGAAAQD